MSEDALRAAESLLRDGRYRSCVSRAYYAAYCAATGEIVTKLSSFAYSWKNPPHQQITKLLRNNVPMDPAKKDKIIPLIDTLRLLREDADYRPGEIIDAQTAKDCVRA